MPHRNHMYTTFHACIITFFALLATACSEPGGMSEENKSTNPHIYRVSTQLGFEELSSRAFNGGDQILLERGQRFEGVLSLKRSDIRPDESITVSDFGAPGSPRPAIVTSAEGKGAVDIRDSGGWTIENLELINRSETRSARFGLYVHAEDSGAHHNFIVRNCHVHDVSGIHDDFNNGGIVFRVTGGAVPTWFDGILIENNEVRHISGTGIRTKSVWESSTEDPRGLQKQLGRHAHQNVIVRGNRVSDVTRNAIVVASADAPLLEYNVMGPRLATETTGNAMYAYATDDAVIQFNEVFGNIGPASDKDRGAFDADYGSRNTIIRYNYSHDNNFAFAIMRKFGEGIYIHHNISVNDRYGFMHYGFYDDHAISDVVVSNNTFYSTHPDMMMFMNFGPQRDPIDTTYVDNVFVFAGEGASWGSLPTTERGNVFENNIVIGLEDPEYIELAHDPLFVAAGEGGTEIDMKDPDRLGGFRLCSGSPAIGAGTDGNNNAEVDFWLETITHTNIGAYGGEGVACDE